MKRKNFFIVALAALLTICFASQSAWAGSKQRHRWEGVAIGLGAAMVGSALINHHGDRPYYGSSPGFAFYYRDYDRRPRYRHGKYRHYQRRHHPRHYRYGHHPRHYRHPGVHHPRHPGKGHGNPPSHGRGKHDNHSRHRR